MLYFFTVWNILLLVFHQLTSKHFDLLYMSYVTMTIGLYLSFVNPKYFVWQGKIIKAWQSKLVIDIVHVVMFLFAAFFLKQARRYDLRLLNTILLLILYISLINPEKVYMIKIEELFTIISMFTIIYCCF